MTSHAPRTPRGARKATSCRLALDEQTPLCSLFDEKGQAVAELPNIPPGLPNKLAGLHRAVGARADKELADPIEGEWEEFLPRFARIRRAFKQGKFDRNLKAATSHLYAYLRRTQRRGSPHYWKARTLLHELNDIFQADEAINAWSKREGPMVWAEFERMNDSLKAGHVMTESQRLLWREKVLFLTTFGNELKRDGDNSKALKIFAALYRFTSRWLVTDELPGYATRANLSYHLGSVYMRLEQHDRAEDKFSRALKFYYLRSKTRPDDDLDDFFFVTRRIAMCIGLGFGWVNLTRGSLARAENALVTARSLFARIQDPVVPWFIELLYGTIRRRRAGKDLRKLRLAVRSLKKARNMFAKQGHYRYKIRACWELALAHNVMGEHDKVEGYLKIVEKYVQRRGNKQWQVDIHVVRSRGQRALDSPDYAGALEEAERAISVAKQCEGNIIPLVDALITRGEVYFYQSRIPMAHADFQQALDLIWPGYREGPGRREPLNPKIAAVCVLRVAQCYRREVAYLKAKEHLALWESLRGSVEHEWVRALAAEVEKEVRNMRRDFVIPANDSTKWKEEQLDVLRHWLAEQAVDHAQGNQAKAARLIGVTSPVINSWLRLTKGPRQETPPKGAGRRKSTK